MPEIELIKQAGNRVADMVIWHAGDSNLNRKAVSFLNDICDYLEPLGELKVERAEWQELLNNLTGDK